jgi:hypothetical protein
VALAGRDAAIRTHSGLCSSHVRRYAPAAGVPQSPRRQQPGSSQAMAKAPGASQLGQPLTCQLRPPSSVSVTPLFRRIPQPTHKRYRATSPCLHLPHINFLHTQPQRNWWRLEVDATLKRLQIGRCPERGSMNATGGPTILPGVTACRRQVRRMEVGPPDCPTG